jgi:hypothetical protein
MEMAKTNLASMSIDALLTLRGDIEKTLSRKAQVEADVGTGVFAKTVGELRKVTTWSENLVITTPQERHLSGCACRRGDLRRNARGGRRQELSSTIAQCLNLEHEIHHTASKLFIFGFEPIN